MLSKGMCEYHGEEEEGLGREVEVKSQPRGVRLRQPIGGGRCLAIVALEDVRVTGTDG